MSERPELAGRSADAAVPTLVISEEPAVPMSATDPGIVILTCANCGAEMIERKCKLICRCGYFLSCSDYY